MKGRLPRISMASFVHRTVSTHTGSAAMNALQHLDLLLRYDRALNLRQAIQQTVRPGARVLDAGCGAGLLSFWAARAGAAEVVAVDIEGLSLARSLARENGLDGAIQFIEADLHSLNLPSQHRGFDVILAMVYLNDPRRDEGQSELVYSLREKHLASGGTMIPERVRYLARACDWPSQDHATRLSRIEAKMGDIEARYGFHFRALAEGVASNVWKGTFPPRGADGRLELEDARILSDPVTFAEIDYRGSPVPYPADFDVVVRAPGLLNTVLWTQELWFGDQLLFSNESVSWVAQPYRVASGSRYTVKINDDWRRLNVATVATTAAVSV